MRTEASWEPVEGIPGGEALDSQRTNNTSGIAWQLKGREPGQQRRHCVDGNELIDLERQEMQEGEQGMWGSKALRGEGPGG